MTTAVPIVIKGCWTSGLLSGTLGAAGPLLYANFPGAPRPSTWYPAALAGAITGSDVNGSTHEIEALFNAYAPWYLGTDRAPSASQYDFVSVALHEMADGLGYTTLMKVKDGLGSWGDPTYGHPTIYDRFLENGGGENLIGSFPNNSTQLAGELTSNNIYFDGPNANSANGGQRPKIYAPSTWKTGSSISHLDEIYNGTANALMTFSLSYGEAIQDPGPITGGLFRDLGWSDALSHTPTPTGTRTPTPTETPTSTTTTPTATRTPTATQSPAPHLTPESWLPFLGKASGFITQIPTPSGTPPSDVQVGPNHAAWTSSIGSLWVMGEVKNNTGHTLRFVKIFVNLFDSAGQVVGNHYGYGKLDNLPPGDTTCFNVLFIDPPTWNTYQFEKVTYWTDGTPLTGLVILNHSGSQKTASYEIVGEVSNGSAGQIRHVEIIATLFDTAGKVARCNTGSVEGTHLEAGQTSSFRLTSSVYSHLPVASYRLQPDGQR